MQVSKEFKIGVAGIIAIVILYVGINFLKGVSTLKRQCLYYIAFNDVKQLAISSPVYADGYKVGIVHDIKFDYEHNGKVIVAVDVDRALRIPKGSSAALESAMLGGSTLHILLAPNPMERCEVGDTLIGGDMPGLMSTVGEMIPDVQQVLGHVDTLLVSLNKLAADPNLPVILGNMSMLTESLNQSSAALNSLLANETPQMMSTFNTAGEHVTALTDKLAALELEKTVTALNTTVASLQQTIDRLNSPDNSIGLLLNDTTLYGNLTQTAGSANQLLIDLRENPKRYVHFSLFGGKGK